LHDYAPLFLDDVEAMVGELRAETDFDISIDRLDAEAVRDGDTAKVTISGFAVSGSVDGGAFEAAYDGECFSGSYDGDTEEICIDELQEMEMGSAFTEELVEAQLGVMTVERDGAWYVSPLRSTFEVLLAVVGAIDRSDLEDPEQLLMDAFGFPFLFGAPFSTGFDESFGSVGGELEWEADELFGDPYAECDAIYDDLPADATEEDYAAADDAYQECYEAATGG
ncbi:MAG: hypothetical protein WD232_04950, partial [Acidimicrobiales bacterium]